MAVGHFDAGDCIGGPLSVKLESVGRERFSDANGSRTHPGPDGLEDREGGRPREVATMLGQLTTEGR